MLRLRPNARPVPDGSRTITIHDSAPRELHPADPSSEDDSNATPSPVIDNDERDPAAPRLVLNLQGGPKPKSKSGKRVVWKEDVIDNEGCGKKKSKICCIYHKPRRFDESSDESSDSESDGGPSRRRNHNHNHDHNHGHDHSHSDGDGGDNSATTSSSGGTATASTSSTTTVTTSDSYEPNAYEHQPHYRRPKSST